MMTLAALKMHVDQPQVRKCHFEVRLKTRRLYPHKDEQPLFERGTHLNGVIVRLSGFHVSLVRHKPSLQQVLVETVTQPPDRGVVWEDKGKQCRPTDRQTDRPTSPGA